MKEMKLSANELAEIVGRLSNSAGSMESYDGREKTIALAKKLYAKCAEEGINLYAYDEQRYLGKVYQA